MLRSEVLTRYRWIMMEAETLVRQADRVMGIGVPADVRSTWPTRDALEGMPRGTNDPEAANAQLFEGYIQKLRAKAVELLAICELFERTLDMLEDDQERVVCRKYYALGLTDEVIGEQIHADQSTVNRIRNRALARLDFELA